MKVKYISTALLPVFALMVTNLAARSVGSHGSGTHAHHTYGHNKDDHDFKNRPSSKKSQSSSSPSSKNHANATNRAKTAAQNHRNAINRAKTSDQNHRKGQNRTQSHLNSNGWKSAGRNRNPLQGNHLNGSWSGNGRHGWASGTAAGLAAGALGMETAAAFTGAVMGGAASNPVSMAPSVYSPIIAEPQSGIIETVQVNSPPVIQEVVLEEKGNQNDQKTKNSQQNLQKNNGGKTNVSDNLQSPVSSVVINNIQGEKNPAESPVTTETIPTAASNLSDHALRSTNSVNPGIDTSVGTT